MIDRFAGQYEFLSNFYPSSVRIPLADNGSQLVCPTVEHAFQAMKALEWQERAYVVAAGLPSTAKMRGRRVSLRPDWDVVRDDVMSKLLRQKFAAGTPLAAKLLDTDDHELVEGNSWGDRYWGVCDGQGENRLGQLLMAQRERLRKGDA